MYSHLSVPMLMQIVSRQIVQLRRMHYGEEFLVRDLFVGVHWNAINRNVRLSLGRDVFTACQAGGALNGLIIPTTKNGSNQQRYRIL